LKTEEDFNKQAELNRATCKTAQLKAASFINPVLFEIADALQKTARDLANTLLAGERAVADEFGAKFEPSCTLKLVIAAGYNFRQSVERNLACSVLTRPRKTLHGILDANQQW
jgi:hypothetical protein